MLVSSWKENRKKKKRVYRERDSRQYDYSTTCVKLYLAFELGNQEWKLGFTTGVAVF